MIRRSLAVALATALLPLSAHAADLLQVYEMARNGDPQLSAALLSSRCERRLLIWVQLNSVWLP
ncbi:hypothetical protein ACEN9Z_15785, partial [Stenotrophomonas geniculata]